MAEPTPGPRRSTRISMQFKQLGQLLQETGDVKAEEIAKALKIQEQQGGLIGQILQSMKVVGPQAIATALQKQIQVTDIHCEILTPGPEVLRLVSKEQCDADKLCPFEVLGKLLCVVMGNPLNRRAITAIEEATRLKVKPFKAPWPKIKELIDRGYSPENLSAIERAAAEGSAEVASEHDTGPALKPLDAGPLTESEPNRGGSP